MIRTFIRQNQLFLWQISFLLVSTSWLLAPIFNPALSSRTVLISQYETAQAPYSWLFRLGDVIAALLFLLAALLIRKKAVVSARFSSLLLLISVLMMVDPLVPTSCRMIGKVCLETSSTAFYIHAVESVLLGLLIFGFSVYDSIKRKALPSILFLTFQVVYGLLYLSQLANIYKFGTLSQYIYQLLAIVWLAWFIASLVPVAFNIAEKVKRILRRLFAGWAYLNGALAIILSLAHIQVLGVLNTIYFANDTAWLAQHGVLVGVTMLYISRHLWRGEHRARQFFLVLLFMEVIKYAIITPQFWLLQLYGLTFAVLFALRPLFNRGTAQLSWQGRLQEAGLVLVGVISAAGIGLLVLWHSPKYFEIVSVPVEFLNGHIVHYRRIPHHLLKSTLVSHTLSSLTFATVFFVLWSLFQPAKESAVHTTDAERNALRKLLEKQTTSSEDFFKLWPEDKKYYWSNKQDAVITYKATKSVVFGLADPIGGTVEKHLALLQNFLKDWTARGYRSCFFLVREASLHLYRQAGLQALQIGSSAIVDIHNFTHATINNKWWRWQLNRGTKAGYQYYRSQPPHNSQLLRQLQQVSDAWLSRNGRREQGFAMGSFSIRYLQQCTLHYLTDRSGHIIAFTNEVPIFNNLPQTTVDLIRFLPEANHAMPYLLAQTIKTLFADNRYLYFDLGFVPLAQMESRLATIAKAFGSTRFSAAGLEQFKNKFEPEWQPAFMTYDGDLADLPILALNIEEAMKSTLK